MDLKIRDDDMKKVEQEIIEEFLNRKLSTIARKDPKTIIEMFLDFQYERYKVRTLETIGYLVVDFETQDMVAFVSNQVPNGYHLAYKIADMLNSDSFFQGKITIDGKDFDVEEMEVEFDFDFPDPTTKAKLTKSDEQDKSDIVSDYVDFVMNQLKERLDEDSNSLW